MVRIVRKSKRSFCISEDAGGKPANVFEFQYQDTTEIHTAWNPNMDIFETRSDLIILVEAAGLDESTVKLQSIENRLVLSGERHMHLADNIERYHQLEIQFMAFQKTIILPNSINENKIKAQYKSGFLEIKIPKKDLKGLS